MAYRQVNLNEQHAEAEAAVVEVEDAVDRAMRYRKYDKSRVPLEQIGFWPGNRGGVGINTR